MTTLETLLPILRCPVCGGGLREQAPALACAGCGARYPLVGGTPLLVREDRRLLEPHERRDRLAHRLVARPWVYDRVQAAFGYGRVRARLEPYLADAEGLLLDVGAGTGTILGTVPAAATYVWLDNDPEKLRGFRSRAPDAPAVLSDAAALALADASVDVALCVSVAHHLPDDVLPALFDELRRVVRRRLVFADAVRSTAPLRRLLWRYDRGAHPRVAEELVEAVAARFRIEHVERFAAAHEFVLCVAEPRGAG